MPRPLRIEFENAWYHVMNRGAGYKDIFKTDKNRLMFLSLLAEISVLFGIRLHAYVLMDNHYHLLINTPRANLSRAMRHLNGIYTQRFNRTQKTDGALFRGRYKAIIVDKDSYLLQVSRYIHLNPVTAKKCKSPEAYKWSSCRYFYNLKSAPGWLVTADTLSMLPTKAKLEGYRQYMNNGADEEIVEFYNKKNTSAILGEKLFKAKLLNQIEPEQLEKSKADYNRTRALPSQTDINNICLRYFKITEGQLLMGVRGKVNDQRKMGMYACRIWGSVKLADIAKLYGVRSHGSITHAVRDIARRLKTDKNLRLVMQGLERNIAEGGYG